MKKVLFLAIAALAYAGIANAQSTTLTGTTLSTTLKGAGFDTTASATVVQGAGAITYKLTVGGTYEFKAISTNWSTLGTDWANVVKGSKLAFTGAATSGIPDYSSTVITNATGAQSVATVTGAATLAPLTVTETSVAANGSDGCTNTAVVNFNPATAPLAGITVTDPATLMCTAANADITIATTGTDSKWIKYTLVVNKGAGDVDVWGTAGTTAGGTSAYQKLTDGSTKLTIPSATFSAVGKYTLTITQIWDKYSYEATNRETLQTPFSKTATITLMPKPVPTLKTNAIQ